jgi:hypothetical protein
MHTDVVVSASIMNATTLLVSWSAPLEALLVGVTDYRVYYARIPGQANALPNTPEAEQWWNFTIPAPVGDSVNATVVGLQPFIFYTVYIEPLSSVRYPTV